MKNNALLKSGDVRISQIVRNPNSGPSIPPKNHVSLNTESQSTQIIPSPEKTHRKRIKHTVTAKDGYLR
jgi:hypothetical protein